MKTLGLIGGISWVSTIDYYRYINEGINERLGGVNFASCIIYSFNYAEIIARNNSGDIEGTYKLLVDACRHLISSGAEGLVLCANTMHMYAARLQAEISVPLIHIAEAVALKITEQNLKTVGLLGTKFTMERDFFKEKLTAQGINTIIPTPADRDFIHQTIFDELGKNIFLPSTRERYINIIRALISEGAEGVILGCTEIPLLICPADVTIPVFDTTKIHAEAAVNFMLS